MLCLSLGDGIELRNLEPWHHREFAEAIDRSRDYIARWLPWANIVVDEESAKKWLYDRAFRRAEDSFHMYGVWQGERLLGSVVFRIFDTHSRVCEFGAWLSPEATGRGLMTKACRHMIDWAVRERGMNRIEWRCEPDNAASQAVARRLGMRLDGTLRQAYVTSNGDFADAQVWAILADEWKPRLIAAAVRHAPCQRSGRSSRPAIRRRREPPARAAADRQRGRRANPARR